MIDLRSDTVTRPTEAMLKVMHNADTGDDVFAEDPTVNRLEEIMADMFGMQAALFCPSGTMTNQIAIKVNTQPLDEIICDRLSHIYNYEGGGYAFLSGVSIRLVDGDRGRLRSLDVLRNIHEDHDWLPRTSLVCIENTVNKGGGSCYSLNEMQEVSRTCKESGLGFHMDGARLFNSLVKQDLKTIQLKGLFDTISICLSKGLGCPVGSVLVGSKQAIKKARKVRKVLGGGMRQAGILAAAGIHALENNIERLQEDHERAFKLEEVLGNLNSVESVYPVETNIVMFDVAKGTAEEFLKRFEKLGILAAPFGLKTVRLVTHLDFTDQDLDKTIKVLQEMDAN